MVNKKVVPVKTIEEKTIEERIDMYKRRADEKHKSGDYIFSTATARARADLNKLLERYGKEMFELGYKVGKSGEVNDCKKFENYHLEKRRMRTMETEEFKKGWLTCQDIIDRSGYSHSAVLKFIKDGAIKSTKHYKSSLPGPYGFVYLVKEEDYEEWIKSWPESKKCKRGRPHKPQKNKKPSDLVRVIRCKDCAGYDEDWRRCRWWYDDPDVPEDGYCFLAERKEE